MDKSGYDELVGTLRKALEGAAPQNSLEEAHYILMGEIRECLTFDAFGVGSGDSTERYPLYAQLVFTTLEVPALAIVAESVRMDRVPGVEYFQDLLAAVGDAHDILLSVAEGQYGSAIVERSTLRARVEYFSDLEREYHERFGLDGHSAQEAAKDAREAATAAEQAASDVAKTRQAKSFADMAKEEARRAIVLQLVAVLALVASAVAAGWFVSRIPPGEIEFSNLLPRLTVAVPGLVFFGYFVTEATAHRRHAAWSRQIAVQLDTIDAYTRILDDVSRRQLLLSFGQAVYSGASLALVVSGRRKDGTEIADLNSLLREIKELVKTTAK